MKNDTSYVFFCLPLHPQFERIAAQGEKNNKNVILKQVRLCE